MDPHGPKAASAAPPHTYTRFDPNDLGNVPESLRLKENSWVCWQERPPESANAKPGKVPINAKILNDAKSNDPATRHSLYAAMDAFSSNYWLAGIGYVFSGKDPFAGIDIDKCRDKQTGVLEPWARGLIRLFDIYTEVSPSQTGVKIYVQANSGSRKCHFVYQGHEVEIYDRGRYFAVTGMHVEGTPPVINDLQNIVESLLPLDPAAGQSTTGLAFDRSADQFAKIVDAIPDDDLIRRIEQSKQGEKFKALMRGDTTGYAGYFSANGTLCTILASWTRCNAKRVDRIARTSGLLVGGEKWWQE